MADSAPRQTHELRRDGELITKTYRSWARGEHRREWAALNLLAEHRPGLAPEPVRADLEGTPPSITMTVVPGRPIAGRWTDDQVDLLAEAMTRLWSVPTELDSIGVHAPDYWRRLVATSIRPSGGTEQKVYDLASAWINGPALDDLLDGSAPQVFGQGDPQTGNLLLDHNRIRLVDFEDARASDACFELANFAEHLGNRDAGLDRLAERFPINPVRLRLCRRLLAIFWFLRLLPVRAERAEDFTGQTHRLLELFAGP